MAQAPPDICVWRSITTIPWCSKVRGWVLLPTALPAKPRQGNAREALTPSGEAPGPKSWPRSSPAGRTHEMPTVQLSRVILTEVHAQRWGRVLGKGENCRQKIALTELLQGCDTGKHQDLAGLSQESPPISTRGVGLGLSSEQEWQQCQVTRETRLGGGMWMLCSCSPASITLSGDTLEKKEGFQTTQFLH